MTAKIENLDPDSLPAKPVIYWSTEDRKPQMIPPDELTVQPVKVNGYFMVSINERYMSVRKNAKLHFPKGWWLWRPLFIGNPFAGNGK